MRSVQVPILPSLITLETVAICAGSGGSMLVERDAEVYCTGNNVSCSYLSYLCRHCTVTSLIVRGASVNQGWESTSFYVSVNANENHVD